MTNQAVKPIKQAVLKDFRKSWRNIERHRSEMGNFSNSIGYRQAVREALEEWAKLRSARE